jgi:putative membrane protein
MGNMFWDRHHELASWWPMGIGLVVWLVIIGLLVWVAVRAMSHRTHSVDPADSAEDLLRRRFAAGEIDEEEYTKRSEVLRRR